MKLLVVSLFAVVIAVASAQQYTSKFDNVDVDNILKNDRILNNYIKCILEKGPCTKEGRELKSKFYKKLKLWPKIYKFFIISETLPDAILSDCNKCSETQRSNTNKVINFLRERKPREWTELTDKYDPQGVYRARTGF